MFYVIEHRTIKKGGAELPKKVAVDEATEQAMIRLGDLIAECRGKTSLRTVAAPCGIPASQLQYIEKGIMSPTADIYPKLINTLHPCKEKRTEMDQLYMAIRKTPPPGVCNTIMLSNGLVAVSGALLAQYQGFSDINMGRGAIVIGLAAVIISEVVFGKLFKNFGLKLLAVVFGAIIYYIVLQLVLILGLNTNDLKLITAAIVAIFLAIPYWKNHAPIRGKKTC